jgi:hypothetical protein
MSLKFATGTKPKLLLINEVNEIEQKNSFAIVYYCGIPLTTFEYRTRLLLSVEYCLIRIKCLCIFIQNIQNWWWVGLRLKIGYFLAQNASPFHNVRYRSRKMTKISATIS